jgi:hypothetical protein
MASMALCGVLAATRADALISGNGSTWKRTTGASPDSEAGGWFINLGITGARGMIPDDAPTVLRIAYVFRGTPAYGKLKVGDRVVGANGRAFTTPHKFGYGMDKFGYEGPMMDFGNALEESQGAKLEGKLTLDVMRDGEKQEVELKLPTKYGKFSRTYPVDCRKTDIILEELYAYLLKRQGGNGSWCGRPHINAFAALALLSSGRKDHMAAAERAMRGFASSTNDVINYGGLDCWKYGLYGICLAEYHLATGEKWVIPELEEINRWLLKAQFTEHYQKGKGKGGWGHRPKDRPGGNGYGPICVITAQAMAAWSLMGQCGIEIDRERYDLAHAFLVKGTNNIGYVWYKDGNGGNNRYADMGRTGASAVAHATSPFGGQEFRDYTLLSAKCIGENHKTFPDTHASPLLGVGWSALGAAVDPTSFRNLMDKHVWFFNLSHCPDGTFYYQPNRDNNPQDFGIPRLSASATMALVLSIRNKSLRIMGARRGIPGFDQGLLGRRTRPAYEAITGEQYAAAWKYLSRIEGGKKLTEKDAICIETMKSHVIGLADAAATRIRELDRVGDLVRAEAKIKEAGKLFGGIDRFDDAVGPVAKSLRVFPKRKDLIRGREYVRLLERAEASRKDRDAAALERFVGRNRDTVYGRAAADALARLRGEKSDDKPAGESDEVPASLREAYFAKLIKELQAGGGVPVLPAEPVEGTRRAQPGAGAATSVPTGAPTPEGAEKFSRLLRARVAEVIASGGRPKFTSSIMRSKARIEAMSAAGTLSVKILATSMPMKLSWQTLKSSDLKSIALAVLRKGNARDHAVAAFHLMAAGERALAREHLRAAGPDAGVIEAFGGK